MNDFELPQSIRSAIFWVVIWVVVSLVFGGGVGSLVGGIAKEAIVDGGKALGKRLSEQLEASRPKAMYASPTNDGRRWCGVDPLQLTYCCHDVGQSLVIEYWGDRSPYSGYGGIQFRRVCYRR
jgi:hypothetical protein